MFKLQCSGQGKKYFPFTNRGYDIICSLISCIWKCLGHYSRFGFGLFKNRMHLKAVQMSFFAIKIIITIHSSSLKKVLKKCENWQKKSSFYSLKVSFFGHFLPCTLTLHKVALENFIWPHASEPTWSLEIDFGSKGIQNQKFRFFSHFSY